MNSSGMKCYLMRSLWPALNAYESALFAAEDVAFSPLLTCGRFDSSIQPYTLYFRSLLHADVSYKDKTIVTYSLLFKS